MGSAYGRPTELGAADAVAHKAVGDLEVLFPGSLVMIGGSVRRRKEIVSDVDLLVIVQGPSTLLERLGYAPPSIDTDNGWHVTPKTATTEIDDVRVEAWWCPAESAGPMLQFVTGPGDLNVFLRQRAMARGRKLSQYGLLKDGHRVDAQPLIGGVDDVLAAEDALLNLLGFPPLPPTDRENWKEFV